MVRQKNTKTEAGPPPPQLVPRYEQFPPQSIVTTNDLSVLTWNLLAHCYNRNDTSWDIRFDAMSRWLSTFNNCEIVCLQEVDTEHFEEFASLMGSFGYKVWIEFYTKIDLTPNFAA
jgi:mRNA deadenylase 3'-5' endonuclease subunit Ccr4